MQEFSVWAPFAKSVKAYLLQPSAHCERGADLVPAQIKAIIQLTPQADGIWQSKDPQLSTAGTRYFLQLDDGILMPDPRSRRQPFGIHGPSEIINPANFVWTDSQWLPESALGKVFYELHIGTFTAAGTFRSAIEKLDHLVDLGVDVVEIMPVNPIPGDRGWGYDGVSIMSTYEPYGSPADLAGLVDAMHARGLMACLDVVYNHFGPDGNYLGAFGPYLTDKHHTPWGQAVNLDGASSAHVRRYLIDNILQWARDFHFDVFRMDAVDQLKDDSEYHIIAEISDALAALGKELGKELTLSVESDANNIIMVTPTNAGGRGAQMQWADDVHHGIHVWLTGEKNAYYSEYTAPGTLAKVWKNGFYHDGSWSNFDQKMRGAPVPENFSGHHFIVCDENHDQVGNRLLGDRPAASLSTADLAISRTLILLSPFTPMLFMGEEWATKTPFPFFTDHGAEIGPHILQGRMNEFANWDFSAVTGDTDPQLVMPDPQDRNTFHSAKLDWNELSQTFHQEFYLFVRKLIQFRKCQPEFNSGDREAITLSIHDRSGWIRRENSFIVFSRDHHVPVELPDLSATCTDDFKIALNWGECTLTAQANAAAVKFFTPGVAVIIPRRS